MEPAKILIVEDDADISDIVKEYLGAAGLEVIGACDGEEALRFFSDHSFDAVVLDIMLPKIDGWRVLRKIRETSMVPVIILSARGEEYDRLKGFDLGVDDYVVKPFSPKELLARVRVALRRNESAGKKPELTGFEFNGLSVDFASRNVTVDGEKARLTRREYDLLEYLIRNEGIVLSRENILEAVWGFDYYGDTRTVDTHVKMLRESIGPYRDILVTVWGTGYKLEAGDRR
ncbi:response regulator transcription factor [Youngiibacter multivorans]|uniref:Stage 0 sporulation protein A homolog n=1 Tax=Youngiibacter multivorans TaxID=937251 RepID=A0ABS4G202_9CLOT|nr:response regulator transcription factor [Youngiibacter multivorans]MBP1918380.1 DNA-binding response OmpR family regulator [Youngiibacter multivorans]